MFESPVTAVRELHLDDALTAATERLPSSTAVAERLIRHLLVNIRGWHLLENFKAARMVRNRFGADSVRLAFDLLAENGIVDIQHYPRQRGRALMTIMKRPWSRIESDPKGRRFLKRLQVNRDAFD